MDIATISSALTSLKTAIEITSSIRESGLSLEKAEWNLKMRCQNVKLFLPEPLADAKMEIADIQELVHDKNKEGRDLSSYISSILRQYIDLQRRPQITAIDLNDPQLPPEGIDLERLQLKLAKKALEATGYNQTEAAKLLGLTRTNFRTLLTYLK